MLSFNKFLAARLGDRAPTEKIFDQRCQAVDLLREGSLAAAWALLASRAVDGRSLVLEHFAPTEEGLDSCSASIKLMRAVAGLREPAASRLIQTNSIKALVDPSTIADCLCAAMRLGLERVAEQLIDACCNDSALMDGMRAGQGLRLALLDLLPASATPTDTEKRSAECSTPLIEAILNAHDGVASRLVSAGAPFEAPRAGGLFEASPKFVGMADGGEWGAAGQILAFSIYMRREPVVLSIIERLRTETPDEAAPSALAQIATLRALVAFDQEKGAVALIESLPANLRSKLALQETEPPTACSEPTLMLMINAEMKVAASALIEAWSRAGIQGLAALDRRNRLNNSALRLAILKADEPLAAQLILAGADVHVPAGKNNPRNMAILAARCGLGGALEAMLGREAGNPRSLLGGDDGKALLQEAAERRRDSVAIALIKLGAPLPTILKGSRLMGPLSWAERSEELTQAVMDRISTMPPAQRRLYLEEMDRGRGRLAQALATGNDERALALLRLGANGEAAMHQIGRHPELNLRLSGFLRLLLAEEEMFAKLGLDQKRAADEARIAKAMAQAASVARDRLGEAGSVAAKSAARAAMATPAPRR